MLLPLLLLLLLQKLLLGKDKREEMHQRTNQNED